VAWYFIVLAVVYENVRTNIQLNFCFLQANVQKVLKRIEDVQGMCEKRKDSLVKYSRHPQHSTSQQKSHHKPPPSRTTTTPIDPEHDLKRKVSQDNQQRAPAIFEKSARVIFFNRKIFFNDNRETGWENYLSECFA